MYITNLRSSSYNADDFCEMRFFIEYNLGIRGYAGASAIRGTITHKVLEIMALQQLAVQNGQSSSVLDNETGCSFAIEDSHEKILECVFPIITKRETHIDWTNKDYALCKGFVNQAVTFDKGRLNPRNQFIIMPETKFHIEIKEPWAYYDYPDISLKGYLTIRGTIDLVIRNEMGLLELVDYKTGRPKWDWNKNKEKTFEAFNSDPQLMLYYYALRKMNPNDDYIVTIYYIQSGEPITVMFDDETMKQTEKMLRKKFEKIKNNFKPKTIHPSFKCKFCHYSKYSLDNEKVADYSSSMCKAIKGEVLQLGTTRVFNARAVDKKFEQYSGGGRTNSE